MGLFDTIYVAKPLAEELGLTCDHCGNVFVELQSKSCSDWGGSLDSYVLEDNEEGDLTMYKLVGDLKSDFLVPYTDEERKALGLDQGGYYSSEAFLPCNRNKEPVDLHRWVKIEANCGGLEGEEPHPRFFVDLELKFTDGFIEELVIESEDHSTSDGSL